MVHKKVLKQFIRWFSKYGIVFILWSFKFFLYDYLHIFKEVERRGIKVAVAGIPKTIDNDISVSYVRLFYLVKRS